MAEFTNRATLTYNNTRTLSNMTTGFLSESLTADKNSLQQSYSAGERITYVVSLINSGQTDYEDLTVTDDLGGYDFDGSTLYPLAYVADSLRYFVNGVVQPAPTVVPGRPSPSPASACPRAGTPCWSMRRR